MPFLSKIKSLWRNLFRQKQVEQDLDDELQAYVEEMATRGAGLTELGDIDRIKDLVRQQRMGFDDLRRGGVIVAVAIVAFVTGASAAVGAMRWRAPKPAAQQSIAMTGKESKPKAPWSKLEGRMVDKTTGQPIPYAEVGLRPQPTSRRYTYTDSEGRFFFLDPPENGYGLEAGQQRWSISGVQIFPERLVNPMSRGDAFHLFLPSDVVVTNKKGERIEGERKELTGVESLIKNGNKPHPFHAEYAMFHYADSVVELRADKVAGMDQAYFVRHSDTRRP